MKPQIYLAKSSKLMPEARAWMARIREAGFRVYDWTKDPGWADPTEENRRIGALNDLHEVVKASVFWWHCDNEISEGAAIEFGYALMIQQVIPKDMRFVLAVSGPRAVGPSAFFSLHPAVSILEADHETAWIKIQALFQSQKVGQ